MAVGELEESFLETPTTVLALVFLGFQVSCVVFQFGVNALKRWLARKGRPGMVVAVEHSVWELTLVGFISLCLIALQKELTTICITASTSRSDWSILHHVYSAGNCPCCLEGTAYVQRCVREYATCGAPEDPYCNCDGGNPTCVVSYFATGESYGYGYPSESAAAPGKYAYSAPAPVGGAERRLLAEGSGGEAGTCVRDVTVSEVCPDGQMPAVSFLALEQVHLLIFVIAVIHVFCGFLVYLAASSRLWFQWVQWSYEDDAHTIAVREQLEAYYASLGDGASVHGGERALNTVADVAFAAKGAAAAVAKDATGDADLEAQGGGDPAMPSVPSQASLAGSELSRARTRQLPATLGRSRSGRYVAADSAAAAVSSVTLRGRLFEFAKCLLLGLNPLGVVNRERYSIMRASYIYTHKLSAHFAFLDHVQRGLEDDLALIVGLSVEFWVIIILFILISGQYGYAVMPFMVLIAAVLIITNAKLVMITRRVTAGGGVGRLTSSIFWFNRPQLLLIPIKLALFLCSFIYASFIFFAWQFGPSSCAFTDEFYPGWVLPWWTILIANTIIFVHMAAVTLPTYSLAVLMGSDIKAHMLPKKFTKKLLAVAEMAKERVKADKAAARAAEKSSGGHHGFGGIFKSGSAASGLNERAKEDEAAGNDAELNGAASATPATLDVVGEPSTATMLPMSEMQSRELPAPTQRRVHSKHRMSRLISAMVHHLVGDRTH